jgi:caffeoyl-CoA O-methyltransferase
MKQLVDKALEDYCTDATTPVTELHHRLRDETHAHVAKPQMQVGPVEGRLLMLLVKLSGAKRAVEIGTFTGYSALNIAEGLPADGELICLDIDAETTAIARRYWDESPWGERIELKLGPALESLETIEGPIDFAFIDADKPAYGAYFDALLPKMPSGGLVVVDNVLWSGRVLDPQSESDEAIVAFNAKVAADPRVEQVMLSVRDGITIARKL